MNIEQMEWDLSITRRIIVWTNIFLRKTDEMAVTYKVNDLHSRVSNNAVASSQELRQAQQALVLMKEGIQALLDNID